MADVEQRFFCHQCSMEIPRVAADFTCPTCNSGFIEELGQGAGPPGGGGGGAHDEDSDHEDQHYDLGQVLGPLESILPGLLGGGGVGGPRGPGHAHHIRISHRGPAAAGPSRAGPQNLGMDQAALENALQDFIFNLAGMNHPAFGPGGGGGGGGARFHFIGPGQGGFQLHGNPGDYAWGRGGLDAIITQLLNQMDGAGPPPMATDLIQQIPTVKVTKEMMEKNSSCSVCWEDLTEGEEVRLLECGHCFHTGCIVPWLELHGTCPVCRKQLGSPAPGPGAEQSGGPAPAPASEHAAPSSSSAPATSSASASDQGAGGGLSGIIQSALNQVFRSSSWSSSQPQPSDQTSSAAPGASSSSSSTQSAESGASNRNNNGSERTTSASDDETPATRRQRLDSDFVDLDFD